MKKVLILMGRYYPKASPNSICMQNIIDAFPKDEYQVEAITYDDELQAQYDIRVVKFKRGLLQRLIYRNENRNDRKGRLIGSVLKLLQFAKQLPFAIIWPWSDPITTLREWKLAKKEYAKERFDIVIAVYMPLSSLIVAHNLKKLNPNLLYVAYFLDSLSGGSCPRFLKRETYNRKALKWEQRLTTNADRIVFMEASRGYHSKVYQGMITENRIHYLDLPMLVRRNTGSEVHNLVPRFVYIGSLALSIRSPEFFLKVFKKAKDRNWRLCFVGDESCTLVNSYASNDDRIEVVGRCEHAKAIEYEQKADVLLNFGNRNPNLTPSKIFEYMSWGKRIISTYPIGDESSNSYLLKYPNALLLDERETNLEQVVAQIDTFLLEPHEQIPYSVLRELFYQNTPDAFIQLLSPVENR